jgi:hypothetical protein
LCLVVVQADILSVAVEVPVDCFIMDLKLQKHPMDHL